MSPLCVNRQAVFPPLRKLELPERLAGLVRAWFQQASHVPTVAVLPAPGSLLKRRGVPGTPHQRRVWG